MNFALEAVVAVILLGFAAVTGAALLLTVTAVCAVRAVAWAVGTTSAAQFSPLHSFGECVTDQSCFAGSCAGVEC